MKILVRQNGYVITLTIAFAIVFLSCKKESNPITPPDSRPILTSADFGKVVLKLVDYDLLHVTHQMGLDLRSLNLVRIGFGIKDSAGYSQSLSVPFAYDQGSHAYVVHFDFSLKMDSMKTVSPLTIRYYLNDSTHVDADTTVLLYKFPYESAEVFLQYSIMPHVGQFQDIAVDDTLFFFHPLGPEGLYEHNLRDGQTRLLLDYVSGDHIAAESVFVFCDVNHNQIQRYNLTQNAVDLVFPPLSPPASLAGLEAYDGSLYALVSRPSYQLNKYTFDGNLVDSAQYSRATYYMTIHNNILYSVEYAPSTNISHLSRFDLQTRTFLVDVPAPWKWEDGIKAHGSMLYYCNYDKRFVGVMPIADLVPSSPGARRFEQR